MKSLIIYHSTYRGNTEKIAKVMAAKINADLIHLKESSKISIEDYDLIGLDLGLGCIKKHVYKTICFCRHA